MDFNFRKNEEDKKDNVALMLDEMREQRGVLTQVVSNQSAIMKEQAEIRKIAEENTREIIDIKDWKENVARITPSDCGTIQKNVKSAVTLFLKKYGLNYKVWWHKAFPAHNTYIANSCGVSKRGDILLKDRDKAIKLSLDVNEDFWKVQALLTEAAINNGMPIKWENLEQNDYWEIIKFHLKEGDLEFIIENNPNQIFDEVAKRQLLRKKAI